MNGSDLHKTEAHKGRTEKFQSQKQEDVKSITVFQSDEELTQILKVIQTM